MNVFVRLAIAGVIAAGLWFSIPPNGIDELAAERANAVVLIVNGNEAGQPNSATGLGTGFVVDENLIVTNHHVIANGNITMVRGKTSQKLYKAKVIASDEFSDLALVRLEDWDDFSATNLPVELDFTSSRDLKLGSKVWSIGHPWGLEWSVSQGVVSSPSRRLDGNLNFLIQTDTRIFQGNSGGPLLDENGNVVGVNVKMMANTGGSFGFAIPSDLAVRIIEDLKTRGKARWAVMGIKMGYTDDGKNVIVKEITPGSAAAQAGLLPNDVILNIITKHTPIIGIAVVDTDQLLNEMAVIHPEDTVTLRIKRNNQISTVRLVPDQKTSDQVNPKANTTNK
jgi:serine protease Do